ncbi:MAG: phosphate ABC transporter permease subunit PstC [Chloroflexota bacterium]
MEGRPDTGRDTHAQVAGRRNNAPAAGARLRADRTARRAFSVITLLPVFLIAAITIALVLRSWPVLGAKPLDQTLFGVVWKPQDGMFGFWPFVAGTAWVTAVGMGLAVVPCVLVSLYLSEYARAGTRTLAKPVLDLLAAIPPVVYGVWGLLAVVPLVEDVLGPFAKRRLVGMPIFAINQPTGFGILAGGIVLAVMVAPFIIAVLYEILDTVPEELRHASLAVGATRWQTIRGVVIPKVLPGIVAGIVLGGSRALGETIAVLMVVGNVVKVPTSIFDAAYPLPALIANNYGDMMSIRLYDAALLGGALVLLVVILVFNVLSTLVLQRLLGRRRT